MEQSGFGLPQPRNPRRDVEASQEILLRLAYASGYPSASASVFGGQVITTQRSSTGRFAFMGCDTKAPDAVGTTKGESPSRRTAEPGCRYPAANSVFR